MANDSVGSGFGFGFGLMFAILFVVIGLPLLVMFFVCGGCAMVGLGGAGAVVHDAARQAEQRIEKREQAAKTAEPAKQPSVTDPDPEVKPSEPPPVAPKAPEIPAFGQPLMAGDIQVTPLSAKVDIVPLKVIGGDGQSKEPGLIVRLRLVNQSKTKRTTYAGWPKKHGFFANCHCRDEHGNVYKVSDFGLGSRVQGDDAGETLDPGGQATAIIAFEVPIPVATELTLRLKGEAIEAKEDELVWKLTRSQWEPAAAKPEKPAEVTPVVKPSPPPPKPKFELRTWSSSAGTMIEATFVSFGAGKVKLQKADGSIISVDLDKLSEADQKWIRELRK